MEKIATFSERLNFLLNTYNMSASVFSQKINIKQGVISRYLSGQMEPRQDRFDKIAVFFHVSHGWLMGYDCEMYQENNVNKIIKLMHFLSKDEIKELQSYINKIAENN